MKMVEHTLKVSDELWRKVKIFKEQNKLDYLNDAVVLLIEKGLKEDAKDANEESKGC